ncbi:carboxylesterase/lipase family protein [Novosphingobium mangrovi (ex Hu et al. 2023)]|uniref:Carboxylic ester hydrolase n=1 Tax=Novosphingobium mangrovi (ex Hu et al. 2023) TaxID=2930094 RepID=A0ABT0AFZ3_9SPHN|nr:carboxylesterase family protein [Novosphingobium mangrovi (ex Hu et al. 2023)]MCJ1962118.1 carboxylesterase family protein [Novosphingobium mangrovi (ex Hu et al. 2023)]
MSDRPLRPFGAMSRRATLATGAAGAAVVLAACSQAKPLISASASPEVATKAGTVRGERVENVYRFLGIPYAQAISGRNRFAPPQPVAPWDGVREALRYAPSSPQQASDPTGGSPVTPAFDPPAYVQSGDECLALNVWTPEGADGSLPVMVWLHGGGWTSGSGSCAIYDGANLAARGDVVVVTINHRLGASGLTDFSRVLGEDFADSANLSIKDMVAALEWVKANIAAFGGNPDLVTIFGESGGGWKVNTLLGSPVAKGLFHRAVVESGPLTRFASHEEADEVARGVLEALEITPETADKLHEITFEQLLEAEAAVMAKTPMSMRAPGFPSGFWPVLEEGVLPAHVYDPVAAPSSHDVPLMAGQTGTEMSLFMLGDKAAYTLDPAGLEARVGEMFDSDAAKVLTTYRAAFPDYVPSALWFRIVSDYMMGALSSAVLDARARVEGGAPVHAYRFDWMSPIADGKLFSPHTMEIPFVFANVETKAGRTMTGGGEEAVALAKVVSEAWVTFARTGAPAAPGLPEWPVYTREGREAMHLAPTSAAGPYMPPEMAALFHDKLWSAAGLS